MFTDFIVILLFVIAISIVFLPHRILCLIPKHFGISYCIPHWGFIYITVPIIIFVALLIKHQSAGFFDFAVKQLRDITENPNKEI